MTSPKNNNSNNNRVSISAGNRKMGAIPSVSLPPIVTCPNCKECAKKCYAAKMCRIYPSVKKAYDNDEAGTTYTGILDNDSWYYNGLVHGEVMPIEMRGEKRPVVPYSWLIERFEVNKKEFEGTPFYDYL